MTGMLWDVDIDNVSMRSLTSGMQRGMIVLIGLPFLVGCSNDYRSLTTTQVRCAMLSKVFALLGSVSLCVGCTSPKITANAANITQPQVDQILRKCNAPMSMVTLNDGKLTISPKEDDKELVTFGCILDALIVTGETDLKKPGTRMYVVGKKSQGSTPRSGMPNIIPR